MADALKPAKKVPKEWMGGIVRWEDYDVPFDVRCDLSPLSHPEMSRVCC